jgi:hypothetical protein
MSDAAKGGRDGDACDARPHTACAHLIKYIRNHRVLDTINTMEIDEFLTSSSAKIIDK